MFYPSVSLGLKNLESKESGINLSLNVPRGPSPLGTYLLPLAQG